MSSKLLFHYINDSLSLLFPPLHENLIHLHYYNVEWAFLSCICNVFVCFICANYTVKVMDQCIKGAYSSWIAHGVPRPLASLSNYIPITVNSAYKNWSTCNIKMLLSVIKINAGTIHELHIRAKFIENQQPIFLDFSCIFDDS